MNEDDNTIHLQIFGEDYSVKSKADEAYLQKIASYVDTHMREIEDNSPTKQPVLRIAVMAAMNISDEVYKLRQELDELDQSYTERIQKLQSKLDNTLQTFSEHEVT